MFTFSELCELIRIVSETRIGGLEVEKDGERVRVDGVPASPQLDPRLGAPLLPPQFAAASQMASGPAPSMRAASVMSRGTVRKNCRNSRIPVVLAKNGNISAEYELIQWKFAISS